MMLAKYYLQVKKQVSLIYKSEEAGSEKERQ